MVLVYAVVNNGHTVRWLADQNLLDPDPNDSPSPSNRVTRDGMTQSQNGTSDPSGLIISTGSDTISIF
jgi:hypothetical protein